MLSRREEIVWTSNAESYLIISTPRLEEPLLIEGVVTSVRCVRGYLPSFNLQSEALREFENAQKCDAV